jgi:hypothetical protein
MARLDMSMTNRDITASDPSCRSPSGSVMRKALVVGIDHCAHAPPLFGCANDAHAVKHMLERNAEW